VPRALAIDDDMRRGPARRKSRKRERGLLLRILLRSPKDTVAASVAVLAIVAILINTLFLQPGRHPSPMFSANSVALSPPAPRVTAVASEAAGPLPRPRPADAPPADASKPDDPMADLVRTTSAPAPSGSARVAAVQRALTDYGYGQLKPTGTIGADTQAAIQRFERERKLPITGQMSDRLVRELGLATGKPIQ
jgi:hypothetical protein